MISLAVAFTAYLCPGSVTLLGISIPLAKLPESAKPALAVAGICEPRPAFELYDPAQFNKARARVAQLGRPTQLYAVRNGIEVGPPLVEWPKDPKFKETAP